MLPRATRCLQFVVRDFTRVPAQLPLMTGAALYAPVRVVLVSISMVRVLALVETANATIVLMDNIKRGQMQQPRAPLGPPAHLGTTKPIIHQPP